MSEYKTLIISQEVEHALRVTASVLVGRGQLSCEQDSGYITYRYLHPAYGTQSLILTAITDEWTTVSFAGHEDFLELIGSKGWISSCESLVEFFSAMGVEADLGIPLEYYDIEGADKDNFAIVVTDQEVDAENLQSLIFVLTNQHVTLEEKDEELANEAMEEKMQEEVEQASTIASEVSEAPRRNWRSRALEWVCSPVGLIVCGLATTAVSAGTYYVISRVKD